MKSSTRKPRSGRTKLRKSARSGWRSTKRSERDERAFVREILDAYDFKLIGEEVLNGRKAWVIDGTPRPGFEAKRKEAKMLPKIKPRFWIDQQDYTWTKLIGEITDTISFGWVIARMHRGTRFEMQQERVNGEVWLPERIDVHLDARVALLKGYNENVHMTYSDYRKFLPIKNHAGDACSDELASFTISVPRWSTPSGVHDNRLNQTRLQPLR